MDGSEPHRDRLESELRKALRTRRRIAEADQFRRDLLLMLGAAVSVLGLAVLALAVARFFVSPDAWPVLFAPGSTLLALAAVLIWGPRGRGDPP